MPKLQFKFRDSASEAQRQAVIERLLSNGARDVRRLFPSERDKELAALFVADVEDERQGQQLLRLLAKLRDVEFAEAEAKRKLIW